MKRLVCVVEGQGEVAAIPNLCWRVLQHLGVEGWIVDKDPIRQPRGMLVDERVKSPRRPCKVDGIHRAVALARARPATAVLVLCDADDDCPATWGPAAEQAIAALLPGAAVMALREYETWLLFGYSAEELQRVGVPSPEKRRDAKGVLRELIPGYLPSVHQLEATRRLDIARVRARSDSFDKLVRSIAGLCGVAPPDRPPDHVLRRPG